MSVEEQVKDLTDMILQGKLLDAFEKHYAENVVMQENEQAPREGKETSREYEKKFLESVQEVHGATAEYAVKGNKAFIEWFMDVTFKDGTRKKMKEVAVQTWENGKIVHEKFYYDTAGT